MKDIDKRGQDWTAVLRRMPAQTVAGEPAGGYTNAFEIVCCDCGDDPDLDYREVSPELQRIRGPYQPITAGTAAYEEHIAGHGELAAGQAPAQRGASATRSTPSSAQPTRK
jgi:hypothetical protein